MYDEKQSTNDDDRRIVESGLAARFCVQGKLQDINERA